MAVVRDNWPKHRLLELNASKADVNDACQMSEDAIQAELRKPTAKEKGVYIGRCSTIAARYGLDSCLANSSPNQNFSEALGRSLHFKLVSFKIRSSINFPNHCWQDTNSACQLFCTAIALQCEPVAKWLAKLLTDSFLTGKPLQNWTVSPFETFSLRMAFQVMGKSCPKLPPAEVFPDFYDELCAASDAEATQAALDKIVIERVRLVSTAYTEYPPFEYSPYDLFPIDLLAHLMVRYSGIPKFSFGPLESPLCDPPLPFPHVRDPLAERVVERCKSLLNLPDVDWC